MPTFYCHHDLKATMGRERLPGMEWTEGGAAVVLSLRALSYTPERWNQFWSKVDRWGFPVAA
jgi:hypothetical protein